jgi:hypothetical protein
MAAHKNCHQCHVLLSPLTTSLCLAASTFFLLLPAQLKAHGNFLAMRWPKKPRNRDNELELAWRLVAVGKVVNRICALHDPPHLTATRTFHSPTAVLLMSLFF